MDDEESRREGSGRRGGQTLEGKRGVLGQQQRYSTIRLGQRGMVGGTEEDEEDEVEEEESGE